MLLQVTGFFLLSLLETLNLFPLLRLARDGKLKVQCQLGMPRRPMVPTMSLFDFKIGVFYDSRLLLMCLTAAAKR